MDYQGNVIRPPSEAESIILQVTVGCSHNRCTFCGAYKDVRFHYKNDNTIDKDISYAAQFFSTKKSLFLADGDVLIMPQKKLVDLFQKINKYLPHVKRIRLYANCKSIRSKSVADLKVLKSLGLDRIYMGLESGHPKILESIRKGSNPSQMIKAAHIVNEAGIFLSATVLLGIAGIELSEEHALGTASVLNQMCPKQIAALTVMPIPGTSFYKDVFEERITLPNQQEILTELRVLVEGINVDKVQFQSNHASNYLPINCRLQRDKDLVLDQIDLALLGKISLMPDYMRAL